jgi:hypothetical protein
VVELDPEQLLEVSSDLEAPSRATLEVVQPLTPEPTPAPLATAPQPTPKRGRASIPSWDEIVFGTKTEE